MKKKKSIRLFFLVGALACCIAYGGGYYQSVRQTKEKNQNISFTKQEGVENQTGVAESATVIAPYKFVLVEEDSYVIVYYADAETIYSTTDIKVKSLPTRLQSEIQQGKKIATEEELYNFLENYSS